MPTRVQLPDGSIGEFPDEMGESQIEAVLQKQYGAPQSEKLKPTNFGSPAESAHPVIDALLTGAGNLGKGILKGGMQTVADTDEAARKHLPSFMTNQWFGMGAPTDIAKEQSMAQAHNAMQSLGKGIERAGEFAIPGGAEERAVAKGLELLPKVGALGKIAPTALRMGASALSTGLINKSQGGTFKGGAAMGAGGAAVGAGIKALAPSLAETALKVRGADRAFGATPGKAILEETQGIRPKRIVDTARKSLGELQADAGNMLKGSPYPVELTPTRAIGDDFLTRSIEEGHPGTAKDIGKLNKQLGYELGPDGNFDMSRPLPSQIPAPLAAAKNRGISNAIKSWNPATASDTMNAAGKMMHHQLGESIADVVPDIKPINQRMHSLFPVVQRANAADLNAGTAQRLIGRVQAHTGAMVPAAAGAMFGYSHGGLVPALIGGTAGLVGGEAFSPEMLMAAARTGNSPLVQKLVIPATSGATLNLFRSGKKSPFDKN